MSSFLVLAYNYRTIHFLMNYAREVISKYSDRVVVDRTYREITVNDILIKFETYEKHESGSAEKYTNYFHGEEFNAILAELDINATMTKQTLEQILAKWWRA